MKTISLLLTFILGSLVSNAQDTTRTDTLNTKTITVTVDNVLNDNGNILISLHTVETFMKGPGIMHSKLKAEKGAMTITFENVSPGTYAILVLHDENDNRRMDFGPNGMPQESYGISNNSMLFGPPIFSDGKFELKDENLDIHIRF
ncbi:DUF2141 domain-containing protein [Mangrovimonas aestuarii]|uniref:DUF2141 domain-containing protein n=1 Tax=Mangrovimonas aestuarii TaxID=3018443 RepID=UPI002379A948|nr:DUF2141 domain-containing protein [Mangrovimonas aestuarii]